MVLETALIIAGGKGTRLEERVEDLPKVLIPVEGVPLIERTILWLKSNNVKNIVLGVAYQKERVKSYLGNGDSLGVKIHYVEHDENGGTGDAFKADITQAIEGGLIKEDNFYAMNADQITDLELKGLTNTHLKTGAVATIVTVKLKTNFGIVEVDEEKRITKFQEKWEVPSIRINSGIYVFNKKIIDYLVSGNIEETTFRKLAQEGKIRAFFYDGEWLTVNDKKELKKAEEYLKQFGSLLNN